MLQSTNFGTYGQLWVKTAVPNELWFTDDAGNDFQLGNDLNASVYKVSGTQVVGAQGATVADATDVVDVITQLNALLVRCKAHGLVAT